jgi:hypothetical protein
MHVDTLESPAALDHVAETFLLDLGSGTSEVGARAQELIGSNELRVMSVGSDRHDA